jgi:hypothetical protein
MVTPPVAGPTAAAVAPTHTVSVSGDGAALFPDFAESIERYGVTTTDATNGSLVVTATTSDPAGTVWINGRQATGASTAVTGLTPGDEVSVVLEDAGGTAVHALVFLPPKFPQLRATGSGAPPGQVLLTLSKFNGVDPTFETAVDRHGVPAYVRGSQSPSMDLKSLPGGHYSVSRAGSDPAAGSPLVELDGQFRPVGSYRTSVPLVHTDSHDSVLLPDGHRILMAYEPNAATSAFDAVIQEVDADGDVVLSWSSADHVLPGDSLSGGADYAHVNSVQVVDDGSNLLASFRNLSQVMKIARTAHDGFRPGDVVWRLGGRRTDFTFVEEDTRYGGGPCAQHTARQLPNGHILVFDNGSWPQNPLCVDPDDPGAPPVARLQTRVAEYALDVVDGTATPVWRYEVPGRFALFAGSSERLPDGDTLVGWASERSAVATLVDPAGNSRWELVDTAADSLQRYFTYRAAAAEVTDAIPPVVEVARPVDGASYALGDAVTADFGCTDRGGSSLVACQAGSTRSGGLLDTGTVGTKTLSVHGVDGEGNVTTVTRTYHVVGPTPTAGPSPVTVTQVAPAPRRQPDAAVRRSPGGAMVGDDVYGGARHQVVRQEIARSGRSATAVVRIENDGNRSDRWLLAGQAGSRAFRVRYAVDGVDVTRRVTAGTFRTGWLPPDRSLRLVVTVTRRADASPGDRRNVRVVASSLIVPARSDAARTVVRAVRAP